MNAGLDLELEEQCADCTAEERRELARKLAKWARQLYRSAAKQAGAKVHDAPLSNGDTLLYEKAKNLTGEERVKLARLCSRWSMLLLSGPVRLRHGQARMGAMARLLARCEPDRLVCN